MASSTDGASNGGHTSSNGPSTPVSHNYDSDKSEALEEYEVEEETECLVCKKPYCDPRLLSCLHSFCFTCIRTLICVDNDQKYVVCRRCKTKSKLQNSADELDPNPAYKHRMEMTPFSAEHDLTCRSCIGNKQAVARCFDCPNFLCHACVQSHKTLKCFDGHAVYGLEETRAERPQGICTIFCKGMHGVTLVEASFYCHTCRGEFCTQCIATVHISCMRTSLSYTNQTDSFALGNDAELAAKNVAHYGENDRILKGSYHRTLSTLEETRTGLHRLVDQAVDLLKEDANRKFNDAKAVVGENYTKSLFYLDQLNGLRKFMRYQDENATLLDIVKLRPFTEQRMAEVNGLKPQLVKIATDMEFYFAGFDILSHIGSIKMEHKLEVNQMSTVNQPKPIARPTATTTTTRPNSSLGHDNRRGSYNSQIYWGQQNYNGYNSYDKTTPSSRDGYYNYNGSPATVQRDAYNQSPASVQQRDAFNGSPRSSVTSSTTMANNALMTSNGREASNGSPSGMQLFTIDHFQLPGSNGGSVGSPMSQMSSVPNSASRPDDAAVFNFNGTSMQDSSTWGAASSTGYQAPGSASGQTWMSDQGAMALSQQQVGDVFHQAGMFETPVPYSQQQREQSSIVRMQMNYFNKFGEYGNDEENFQEPSGVAVDNCNQILVADSNNHRIQVFNMNGKWVKTIDKHKMMFLNRITVSRRSGRICLTERTPTHRVQVLDPFGHFLYAFGDDILQHPRGITMDDDDNIIVIECKVMRCNIFTIDGQVLHRWTSAELLFPNSVAVNNRREVFICDNRQNAVMVFSYEGTFMRKIGGKGITDYPISVNIDSEGHVVVADNHNNFNITVFKQTGELVSAFESKGRHAQCYDVAITDSGVAAVTSKDYKVFCYPYKMDCHYIRHNPSEYIHPKEERTYGHGNGRKHYGYRQN